jgi:hypothetical protein
MGFAGAVRSRQCASPHRHGALTDSSSGIENSAVRFLSRVPMRIPIPALLGLMLALILGVMLGLVPAAPALALSGATADGEDRFPYVVEIRFDERLVCSGTVLYPRIVVTSAHCLQHKVRLPGGLFYVDEYAEPAQLTVTVTRAGTTASYDVANVTVSPGWRAAIAESNAVSSSNRSERFAHDLALVITKQPIEVGLSPSLSKLAAGAGQDADDAYCASKAGGAVELNAAAVDTLLRGTLMKQLGHRAVVVAFGAESCTARFCAQAGTRRYVNVALRDSAHCFRNTLGKPQAVTETAVDDIAAPPPSVWCLESSVLPGDSGGALMVEGPRGELYYLGVISAQQGRRVALADTVTDKRSLGHSALSELRFHPGGSPQARLRPLVPRHQPWGTSS